MVDASGSGSSVIVDSLLVDNLVQGARGGGGACMTEDDHSLRLDSCVVSRNAAREGGALWLTGQSRVTVSRCVVSDSRGASFAGAVAASGSVSLTMVESRVEGSVAPRVPSVLAYSEDISAVYVFRGNVFTDRSVLNLWHHTHSIRTVSGTGRRC